jgi:hypothetical protein
LQLVDLAELSGQVEEVGGGESVVVEADMRFLLHVSLEVESKKAFVDVAKKKHEWRHVETPKARDGEQAGL